MQIRQPFKVITQPASKSYYINFQNVKYFEINSKRQGGI